MKPLTSADDVRRFHAAHARHCAISNSDAVGSEKVLWQALGMAWTQQQPGEQCAMQVRPAENCPWQKKAAGAIVADVDISNRTEECFAPMTNQRFKVRSC